MMAESEVRNFKPDPRDLEGMEKRMEKIERSVTEGERVGGVRMCAVCTSV